MKKRLVGAIVLVSLVVIFVPMLLDEDPMVTSGITETNIPPRPKTGFSSHILPQEARQPLVAPQSRIEPADVVEAAPETSARPGPKTRAALSAWVIQVASFQKRENANKLVDRLRAKKLPAFMEQASVDGKTIFRVRVGPEVDRKKAEGIRARIEKGFKLKGKIERYP